MILLFVLYIKSQSIFFLRMATLNSKPFKKATTGNQVDVWSTWSWLFSATWPFEEFLRFIDMTHDEIVNDMVYEECRLETFKKWPYDAKDACNAAKMAEAGFYFIGSDSDPDLVECFLCSKKLNGWEREDDPWSEHISHAKYCMFAQYGKAQKNLSVSEFLLICFQHSLNNMEKVFNNQMHEFHKDVKILTSRF